MKPIYFKCNGQGTEESYMFQVSHWPAGKNLGGSSTLSTLTYHRGNVQGFDEMATELGDGKWSTKNMLEYYNKI